MQEASSLVTQVSSVSVPMIEDTVPLDIKESQILSQTASSNQVPVSTARAQIYLEMRKLLETIPKDG